MVPLIRKDIIAAMRGVAGKRGLFVFTNGLTMALERAKEFAKQQGDMTPREALRFTSGRGIQTKRDSNSLTL